MTTTEACRVLILDFDGVIIESNAFKTITFQEVFSRFPGHLDAMMAWHHAHEFESRYLKFRHLAERLGRPGDQGFIDDLARDFSSRMVERAVACPFVRGAPELLADFADRIPLYLVSNTPETELEQILERRGLTGFFARVCGCPPWTKTGAVRQILDDLGGSEGVMFLGDSAGDQRTAAACGIRFIGRDSGLAFDPPEPAVYADLAEIHETLRSSLRA